MIGRGAVIKPWLFAEIAREVYGCSIEKPVVFLPAVYTNFIELITESFRPERRLGRLKEFTHYFARNFQFGHLLSSRIQGSTSVEEAQERAGIFFETNRFLR
jgi:tRNA-dihydrouridine synthase